MKRKHTFSKHKVKTTLKTDEHIKILIVSVEPLKEGGSSVQMFQTAKEANRTDRKAKQASVRKHFFNFLIEGTFVFFMGILRAEPWGDSLCPLR